MGWKGEGPRDDSKKGTRTKNSFKDVERDLYVARPSLLLLAIIVDNNAYRYTDPAGSAQSEKDNTGTSLS